MDKFVLCIEMNIDNIGSIIKCTKITPIQKIDRLVQS